MIIGVDDDGQVVHADKAAVIDSIQFTNPHDVHKSDGREIDGFDRIISAEEGVQWRCSVASTTDLPHTRVMVSLSKAAPSYRLKASRSWAWIFGTMG